jgi:hypothetical protein
MLSQKSLVLGLFVAATAFGQVADFSEAETARKVFKPSFQNGGGALSAIDGALEYRVEEATEKDFSYLWFNRARVRASQDFEVVGTFFNDAVPETSRELVSIGIEIYQADNLSNRVSASLSVARLQGYFSRTVFTQVVEDGETAADAYTAELRLPTEITLKLSYDRDRKVFSASYDTDPSEETNWELVGSFGINGEGGDAGNASWGMRSSEKFLVYAYGYSENLQLFEGDTRVLALEVKKP